MPAPEAPITMERTGSRSPLAHLEDHSKPYVPVDVLGQMGKAGLAGFGGGLFVAAVHNALTRKPVGAFSVFTRGAPVIGLTTAAPAIYAFFAGTMGNLREKDDAWAQAFGGFMGGAVLGLPFRRIPHVLGFGAMMGSVNALTHVAGGRIDSFKKEDDEFERKEIMRRTTRVPVEQTIAEIGEGRGIRPPGYEERRRERIKEKYGFEINPVSATVDGSE